MKTLLITYLFIAGIWLTGCSSQGAGGSTLITIEEKTVMGGDDNLLQKNGYLLYDGEPFSGKVLVLYENGDTASVTSYLRGKEHGRKESMYRDGAKMEERYFRFGKKEGLHKGWYADGSMRYEYNFENGEYQGSVKEWYENGQMYRDFNYEKGYEEGLQQAWQTTGKIKANYVVKEGRKYGFTGTNNCKSLWDDETTM